MQQHGSSPASAEADFCFCIHPGCPNWIMGTFDLRIVKIDHSDHKDFDNFIYFHDSHKKFLDMVECGNLSPPSVLEHAVREFAKALSKKFTLYLDSFQDELIKYSMKNTSRKIRLDANHRYELYGALVAKNE
jgi:hypothetical protein